MNCKKLLVSSLIFASVLCASQAFAADVQGKVEKNNVKKQYASIEQLVEYNKYAQADALINDALKKNPNDVEANALKAVSLAKQYKLAPAQEILDKLKKQYPNNPDVHYAQGLVYMMKQTSSDVEVIKNTRNLINQAIKEFVAAVNTDSNMYQAYNAMGVATLKLGNRKDAKELFEIAAAIKPDYATAYDNLGNVEMMDNNLAKAKEYFQKSLKYNSTNPTAMYHMAQVAVKEKDLSGALTWLNHSLAINPNSSPALNLQGEIYQRQGNQAAAINSFKKAVAVKPESSRPYINLANIYETRADQEFAMEQLKTVVAINPGYKEGVLKIADLSLGTKKYEQAVDYYSRLINDETYGQDAIVGLANSYYELSKEHGDNNSVTTNRELYVAYDYINKAVEKSPYDLKLHLAKLKIAKLTNQSALSTDSLNYIVQAASDNMMDSVIKGEAFLALGREKDAVFTFENAVNFASSADDQLYLAEVLIHNKQFRTSRLALKKALEADPNNVVAKNMLNYVDLCQTKSEEFYGVATRQFKEKNYASTIEYCNRAIDFYHNDAKIAKLKAQAYEAEKNYQGAVKYYQQYLSYAPDAADKADVKRRINRYVKKLK